MSKNARGKTREDEHGQSIVEFAMVVAFLLLTLFGIVDFSRLFFAYATMSNGVREGARYGIVQPTDLSGIEAKARAMMVVIGGTADIAIEFPGMDDGTEPGCQDRMCRVVVRATSDLNVWTPVLPHMQIVAQATMHIE